MKILDRFLKKLVTVSENILHDEPWLLTGRKAPHCALPALRLVRIVFPVQMSAPMNVNITPSGEIYRLTCHISAMGVFP